MNIEDAVIGQTVKVVGPGYTYFKNCVGKIKGIFKDLYGDAISVYFFDRASAAFPPQDLELIPCTISNFYVGQKIVVVNKDFTAEFGKVGVVTDIRYSLAYQAMMVWVKLNGLFPGLYYPDEIVPYCPLVMPKME